MSVEDAEQPQTSNLTEIVSTPTYISFLTIQRLYSTSEYRHDTSICNAFMQFTCNLK